MARMILALGLRNWVSIIYKHNTSRVLTNGIPSNPIPIHSGVRQGCPLSAMLYTITIEPLIASLRNNPLFTGYPLQGANGKSLKTQEYMDDVTIVTTEPQSIPHVIQSIDSSCKVSGAIVNETKSEDEN
ncbi:unnamed protein product [Coregonus sp. 'balchen']|nr:unnamed protein product [Coregonus sp. 'balchen']